MGNMAVGREIRVKLTSAEQDYYLNGVGRYTLSSIGGLGLVETTRIQQQLPMTQGHLDLGYRLPGRTILLRFVGQGCTNEDYWDMREELVEMFQPRFADPITLTFTLPNHKQVATDVNLIGDFGLDLNARFDGRTHNVVVAVQSDKPFLRDITQKTVTISSIPDDGWQIAPLWNSLITGWRISDPGDADNTGWHLDDALFTATILVSGGSRSGAPIYPVIRIYGPCLSPIIINQTTDERLAFTASGGLALEAGNYVEMDLENLSKPVRDINGRNLSGYLAVDSDLAFWHLAPNGELLHDGTRSNGNNIITVTGDSFFPHPTEGVFPYAELIYYDLYMGV